MASHHRLSIASNLLTLLSHPPHYLYLLMFLPLLSVLVLFFSNSRYCFNNFSSKLSFSIFSFFIVLSEYFLNIIYSTIFPVVPFTYFESFSMLIRVFCCIFMFIIIFSILFILSSIFSNLLSIRFIALNISSINIYTFLASILFRFFNPIFHKFFPIII